MITLEWWVIATIIAALTQTLRSAVQRQMKPVLGDDGASYIRFLYALPFAWFMVFSYQYISDIALPATTLWFWIWVNLASLTQIIFTVLLIRMFSQRSFAAGTAFSKTEVLQAAILETIILGVMVSLLTGLGIMIGVIAVIIEARAIGVTERGIGQAVPVSGELSLGSTIAVVTDHFTKNRISPCGITGHGHDMTMIGSHND